MLKWKPLLSYPDHLTEVVSWGQSYFRNCAKASGYYMAERRGNLFITGTVSYAKKLKFKLQIGALSPLLSLKAAHPFFYLRALLKMEVLFAPKSF